MSKVLNLDKKQYFKGDLKSNLSQFYKNYSGKILIKYKKKKINTVVEYSKLANGLKYISIFSDDDNRETPLMLFKIDFIDIRTAKFNGNAYIANIHRSKEISGTTLVNMCITICKMLAVKTIIIGDGTEVYCYDEVYDLSFLKLIETGKTFYMRFGFENDPTGNSGYYQFKNLKELKLMRNNLINYIRNIKMSDIIKEYKNTLEIVTKCMAENNKGKLIVTLLADAPPGKSNYFKKENPAMSENILSLFVECLDIFKIINEYKKFTMFYELLVYLFNYRCEHYNVLNKYILNSSRIKIKYGSKTINRPYIEKITILNKIRYSWYILKLD